jgi:germacradienol/geosmin synthase
MTRPQLPAQRRRTLSHFATYFEGIRQESVDRARGRHHDFSTFIERRRFAGGVLLCQDFLEIALGLDLPDAVHATLEMHLFFMTVSDVTHWMSDIASYPRDVRLGQVNFLSIVRELRGGDLQDATDYIAEMIRGRMALFDEAVQRLPYVVGTVLGLDQDVVRQTQVFAHGLRDWIGGFNAWIIGHPRYTAATAAQYQTAGYLDEAIFDLPREL